jgi:hypothetical protein
VLDPGSWRHPQLVAWRSCVVAKQGYRLLLHRLVFADHHHIYTGVCTHRGPLLDSSCQPLSMNHPTKIDCLIHRCRESLGKTRVITHPGYPPENPKVICFNLFLILFHILSELFILCKQSICMGGASLFEQLSCLTAGRTYDQLLSVNSPLLPLRNLHAGEAYG